MRELILLVAGALLAALVGAAAADDPSSGTVGILAVMTSLVIGYLAVTDAAATRRWPKLSRWPGAIPRPQLVLGHPVLHTAGVFTKSPSEASEPTGLPSSFTAMYVKVPVTNDPDATIAADDVQGWLDFQTAEGRVLAARVQARWTHATQAPDRTEFAPVDDPALNEIRIAPGLSSRNFVALDVVASADELGGFFIWNNESMTMVENPQYALGDREIHATLTVRGSNTAEESVTLRVMSTSRRPRRIRDRSGVRRAAGPGCGGRTRAAGSPAHLTTVCHACHQLAHSSVADPPVSPR